MTISPMWRWVMYSPLRYDDRIHRYIWPRTTAFTLLVFKHNMYDQNWSPSNPNQWRNLQNPVRHESFEIKLDLETEAKQVQIVINDGDLVLHTWWTFTIKCLRYEIVLKRWCNTTYIEQVIFSSKLNYVTLHNGANDSQKRQSQLWDQVICQTKTANFFCEIDWSYLCLATVWQILNMKKHLQNQNCWNLAKRHPYLRWSWERTIDSIRWCYQNQIGI